MIESLTPAVRRRALTATMLSCVAIGLPAAAQPQAITLANPSFEDVPIAEPDDTASPEEITLPFVPGWQETGVQSTEQGFTGLLDNGYFLNIPTEFSGFPIPAVPNAHDDGLDDAAHVGYLRFNATANSTGPATTISQQTSAAPQAHTVYTFTMGLGVGFLQAPNSTDPVNNPYTAILSIGTYDDGSTAQGGFTAKASNTVYANTNGAPDGADVMTPDGFLNDFSVSFKTPALLPVVETPDQLVIHVQQDGGTTGSINLDHARFVSAPVGDMNGDGVLTNGDIAAFVLALTDPDAFANTYPGLDPDLFGDFNDDGSLTNGDIAGFVQALTGSTPAVTPEPTSLALLGLGGLLLTRRRR